MASIGEVRKLRNAETELTITKSGFVDVVTGEPREIERLIRGSERGRWKSTCQGNSLAAYSTSCPVLRGPWGEIPQGYSPLWRA